MFDLKEFVRPPFANYDVVVYFGAGLFCVPFFYRYAVTPLGLGIPSFLTQQSDQLAIEVIRILAALMFVYVAGHLIAYFASQLIEKALDRFLGKVSTAILVSSQTDNAHRNQKLRTFIRDRSRKITSDRAWTSSVVRGLFHGPAFLHYLFIYLLGIFGYFDSRLPTSALKKAEDNYKSKVINEAFATDTKWYKSLEYYVINRSPAAVSRMYNYLVIAGLFRSLAIIFLVSSWAVVTYAIVWLLGGDWALSENRIYIGRWAGLAEWFVLSTLAVFCTMAYIKFQRRYAEEAIFALAFAKECD